MKKHMMCVCVCVLFPRSSLRCMFVFVECLPEEQRVKVKGITSSGDDYFS